MAAINAPPTDIIEHNRRITNHMPLTVWKRLKGLLYSALIIALAVYAIQANADPTAVFIATATVIAVITGVEVKEVEIATAISIRFWPHDPGDRREDDDP